MLLLLLAMGTTLPFCRCAQEPLDRYFESADIVVLGRIASVRQADPDRIDVSVTYILRPSQPLKGSLANVTLATRASSASCGVPVEPGQDFVIFASLDPTSPGTAWFDTCSGTRQYPVGRDDSPSFIDTPDNMVVRRLFELADGTAPVPSPDTVTPWTGGIRELKAAPASRPAPGEQRKLARVTPRSASYLDADWDGRVFLSAGGRRFRVSRLRALPGRAEYTIDLIETRRVRGTWWLRVEIYETSPCSDPAARPTHGGWIPAFSSRGRLVADSWPGGC